jgi:DNA-binding transcriptional ArsR family regulator
MVKREARVTAVFAALADATRRRILEHLTERGETRVTALARPFRISLPAVSRHLRVLEKAGIVRRQRHGREHRIRVHAAGLKDVRAWLTHYSEGWDFSFDALDGLLKNEQGKGVKDEIRSKDQQ